MAATFAVDLAGKVAVTPAALEIVATLSNRGPADVGVFNRIPVTRGDGTMSVSPDVAYVELEGDTLLVRKMALPVPEGLTLAAYVPPYASRLAPGQVLTETIRLPRPVKVMQTFRRALIGTGGEVVTDRPGSARTVTVAYGLFPLAGVRLVPENPAHPEALTALPAGPAVTGQRVLSFSATLVEPIAVLDYRVVPWP